MRANNRTALKFPQRIRCDARLALVSLVGLVSPLWVCSGFAQDLVITIDATRAYSAIPHGAAGANHLWLDAGDGTVNTSDCSLKSKYVASMQQMSLGSLRWPCGTRANLFRWKWAIGPVASRKQNPLGEDDKGFSHEICYFGPDECGKLKDQTGMDIAVLINCATGDANEAADLVEYVNAPLGTNPRGGTAWAEVRAANGHPAPYGFKYFEIGNEYYLAGQNYWLDPLWGNRTAYAQAYALGGFTTWVTNGVVEEADFSPSARLGDGTANQVKYARYAPVDSTKPCTLLVNGEQWTRVTSLASSGAADKVYTLDFASGTIRFGDGVQGSKPGSGQEILLSYTCGRHDGFVDYYREMKAADPSIKVYSSLDWAEFCSAMGAAHPYDGLVRHMYPFYGSTINVATSDAAWAYRVTSPQYWLNKNILDRFGMMAASAGGLARKMDVVITEYGAPDLSVTTPDDGETTPGHPLRDGMFYGLFMQACSAYGLPLCMKHMLISKDGASDERKQFLFHSGADFPIGAIGHAAAQVARLKDKALLASWSAGNPVAASQSTFGQRQALQVTAARDADEALWLLVFNIDRDADHTTTVKPMGFLNGGSASVWTVSAANDWSNNWDGHTNDVSTTFKNVPIPQGSFQYTFPKHSISVMQVPKSGYNGGWQTLREYSFTSPSTASNAWYPGVLEWYLAGKAGVVSAANIDLDAGYALRLVGEDPSHGRGALTLPPGYRTGVLRLTADVLCSGQRSDPLYMTVCDDTRAPIAGLAFSHNHDGKLAILNSSGAWDLADSPYYQDNWIRVDLIVDLDARKYDVMVNGFRLFVGGEGRDTVSGFANPVNKISIETGTASGDSGTFYVDNVTVARFVTNASPALRAGVDRSVIAGQVLSVTNSVADSDVPTQEFTWAVLRGPTNAVITVMEGTNSLLQWRPALSLAPGQIPFALKVTDNGIPPLSATQNFAVAVNMPAAPVLSAVPSAAGVCSFTVSGDTGPDYTIYNSTNLETWAPFLATNPSSLPFLISVGTSNFSRQFFRISLGPE